MKNKDFRDMTTEELNAKLKELKSEHFNLRFSHATGQLANPMMLNSIKKDIARVLTILREREIKEKKAN
ncbi:MAG: 50S ribosomal protein L29 [Clostridia bacterium]|nr:50S ribosomal protein L29 [Clostridia bacterium]